jgi:3-hydroxyisobutyrate dehydrogenase-like beta-hydroxyacid dehydrogenase
MAKFRLGLIGYGEVGRIFGAGLQAAMDGVCAWDVKFNDEVAKAEALTFATQGRVQMCESLAGLCENASLIISTVTASQTLAVAADAARHIRPGCVFLDMNSASPGTKQQAACLIEAAGGQYLEAAVMTSVPPYGVRVPMLLGGPHADRLLPALQAIGLDARVASAQLGVASATKMCRSVMIKGLEALVIESFTAARHYGVEDAVVASLQETFPGIDWPQQGRYFFSRVAQHGRRRAEEMREATLTVKEAGFEPFMAAAIAQKHDWMAARSEAGHFQALGPEPTWQAYADRLMAARGEAANDD